MLGQLKGYNISRYCDTESYISRNFVTYFRSIKKNGCLQVLKGSHRLGRINHILSGEQAGAEPDILDAAISQFPLEYVEMEPGDVLFFHCNLLHSR